jgi:hypothetical protein
MYTGKKSTNESQGEPEQKIDAVYGTILITSKCFQRSKRKLHINFSPELDRLKNH